jgi:4,5-DOPA dioxygenase extradiol
MNRSDRKTAFDRREVLGMVVASAAAVAAGSVLAATGTGPQTRRLATGARMPTIFVAHGSPMLLDDAKWVAQLHAWAGKLPRPKAILMLSAHWEERPITLAATTTVPLVYDFYGFPDRYYKVEYPAPGAPDLAQRVRDLLEPTQPVADAPDRGLDHGAYIPLIAMYPNADVPTLQLSLPTLEPKELLELGRALEPLRDEGVLIVGSGFLSHNLRLVNWEDQNAPPPSWASEFDAWNAEVLAKKQVDSLLDYRRRAPGVERALPTHEHFVPVVTAMGAALGEDAVSFPITGFYMGTLTKRSVQFG